MKIRIAWCSMLLVLASSDVFADTRDDELRLLREQVELLSARLAKLEQADSRAKPDVAPRSAQVTGLDNKSLDAKIDQAVAAKVDATVDAKVDERVDEKMAASAWTERMRWKGDFRYRYENIGVEGGDDRNRSRIRARVELQADISPTLNVGFGLASGSADPVSSNQTLGNGGSGKDINLNLAYFEWKGLANTSIVGGKFKNVLYRPGGAGLLWDGDWNPEGTAFQFDNGSVFVNGIGTWLESDSKQPDQEFSFGLQAGFNFAIGDNVNLTAGAGYYEFDTAGKGSFFGDDDDFFGNSFDADTLTYQYNYEEVEAFAELSFRALGQPSSLFADYVRNLDPDDYNRAYAFGATLGQAKKRGTWEVGYTYQDIEADALLGLLADSDFGGGGTDSKGSAFSGAYAIDDNWNFQLTYFVNDIGLRSGHPQDLDRLQLDLNFKYK